MAEANLNLSDVRADMKRAVRRRPSTPIPAETLAEELVRDRPRSSAEREKALKSRFGIDPDASLASMSNVRQKAESVFGNQPTASALRHVPIGRLTAADLAILLMHRESTARVIMLCVDMLSQDPLLEAQFYPGDLLKAAAERASTPLGAEEARSIQSLRNPLLALIAQGVVRTWDDFEADADRLRMSPDARQRHRRRIARGERQPENDPFWRTVDRLNLLAETRRFLEPLDIQFVAQSNITYARYRPMTGLEPVPVPDLLDKDISERLDGPDTFYFVRETEFVIARDVDRDGYRLHHYAHAATNNHLGIAFEEIADAKHYATANFGVAEELWLSA